jgi:hypothetical protein
MKKVLAVLLAIVMVSFAVPALADPPQDLDASLTIEHPSGVDGIFWNSQDTCCASQSMLDLSIESLNFSFGPEFNPQLDANVNIDESYTVSGDSTSNSTADSDADANADANSGGESTATATADGEGDAGAFAAEAGISGAGAGAGAIAATDSDSESEVEAEGDFSSDVDTDIDIDWSPTCCYGGELNMENVVVLYMQQSGGQDSLVGAAVSMVGDAGVDYKVNNVFMQEQIQRPQFDGEGVLVGASGIQQQASQSQTNLVINSSGSVPVLDGSISYHEGLNGL